MEMPLVGVGYCLVSHWSSYFLIANHSVIVMGNSSKIFESSGSLHKFICNHIVLMGHMPEAAFDSLDLLDVEGGIEW